LGVLFWERGRRGNILIDWVNVFAQTTSGDPFVRSVNAETMACVIPVFTALVSVRVTMAGQARNVTDVMTDTNQNRGQTCQRAICVKQDSLEINVNFARLVTQGKIARPVTPAGTRGNMLPNYSQRPSPMTTDTFVMNVCQIIGGFIVWRVHWVTTFLK